MNTPIASRLSLRICGFALGAAALLALPSAGSAQSLLYQWNFDNAGSLAPTATGGGVTGGNLAITNAGGATSSTVNAAGVRGATGDYGLDLSSTNYGTNGTITNASVGSLPTLTTMTVTMWIKASTWGGANSPRLLQLNSASAIDGDKLYFSINGGSQLQLSVNNTSATGTINTGQTALPTTGSSWVFVAFTWDSSLSTGTNFSTFLGDQSTTVASTGAGFGGTQGQTITGVTDVSIGNRDTNGTRNFKGVMDDIRIYNGVMTLSQLDAVRLQDVSAIPEPSTYAAILGGLALAGAAIRRRRLAA